MQVFKLSVRGKANASKPILGGQADIDLAQFAFKGQKEQQLNLTVPLQLNEVYGDCNSPGICKAELKALVTAIVAKVSSLRLPCLQITTMKSHFHRPRLG